MTDTSQQFLQKVQKMQQAGAEFQATRAPLVAYAPESDLLNALGISQDQYNNLDSDAQQQIQYLQGLIGKLNSQDYANAIATIQSQSGDIFKATSIFGSTKGGTLQNLQSLVGGLQAQIPKGYVAPPVSNPQQPGPPNSDILQIAPGTTDLTDAQKAQWQSITGQDFDQMYNNFTSNYAVSLQNYSITSGMPIGGESLWSKGPASSGLSAGQGFANPVPLSQLSSQQKQQYSGITKGQFAQMMMSTKVQAAAYAEKAARASWAYGDFPADQLDPLIYNAVNSMSMQSLAEAVNSAGGVQAWVQQQMGTGGVLGNIVTEFTSEHPQYQQASQPSTISPNVQQGVEAQTLTAMNSLWSQYFHRAPTAAEDKYFAGWDQATLQAWVNKQQSVDNPTMTIGERTAYLSAADTTSQKLWGVSADSRVADLLDGHFNPHATAAPSITSATNQALAQTTPATPAGASK